MRRKHIICFVVLMFLTWNMLMYYTLVTRSSTPQHNHGDVKMKLNELQTQIEQQIQDNEKILSDLRKLKEEAERKREEESHRVVTQVPGKILNPNVTGRGGADSVVLPILMIACNRKDAVTRSLDKVLKFRNDDKRFPIIVSQDCGHEETAKEINKYVEQHGIIHIKQPDLRKIDLPWPQRKFEGYYNIARHYKWALTQVFQKFNYSTVIIIEDDLEIAPDFFEYFAATYRILHEDKTLWCVSAWNDNGKKGKVKEDPELLHRTDFFPGLGWMLTADVWKELGPKWPKTFWDDWMRHPDQRQNRSCIRPEISRTSTFGKKGVSHGLFYEKHLKLIQLNDQYVPFTKKDLSYLAKDKYDPAFQEKIYSLQEVSLPDIQARKFADKPEVRITYRTKNEFKNIAKKLDIMDDFKAGVPRTAYMGVVSISIYGQRVHVVPPQGWKGYDPTWG